MKTRKLLFTAIAISFLFNFTQSANVQTGYYSPSLANFDAAMTNILNDSNLKNITLYIKLEDNENVGMFNRFKLNTSFYKELLINPSQLFSREVFLKNPALDYVKHHNKVTHSLISGDNENISV